MARLRTDRRSPGDPRHHLLKVFFGADPAPIAARQAEAHRAKLLEYADMDQNHSMAGKPGHAIALRAGLKYEQLFVQFWESLAGEHE